MILRYAGLALAGYLVGSFPTAYLFVRKRRGLDIRSLGTGNVGGANVGYLEGVWATVVVGAADFAKGLVPTWVALRAGLGVEAGAVVALAAVAGHDWPIWLGFRGGRGAATTLGTLVAVFPLGFIWVLGLMAVGKLTSTTAVLHLVAVAFLPLVAFSMGERAIVVWTLVALLLLMVVKRLEANRGFRRPAPDMSPLCVFLDRLLLDREPQPVQTDESLGREGHGQVVSR